VLAGTAGLEYIHLMSSTTSFVDRVTRLRTEQQTEQSYGRFYIGGQAGGHGNGFLRPHAGANAALVWYNINTDVVIPNDANRENEIRQNLRSQTKFTFGYDFTLGLDLNFNNKIALDGGVRYVKSFKVPQQLGDGSVQIYPQYFQIYFGIGASFEMLMGHGEKD
jgi:opacity protein-like surface antigen